MMQYGACFFTPLSITHITGKWWRLNKPLAYYSALLDATLCPPAKFVFDGDSSNSRPTQESCIHDFLYRGSDVSYITADRVFGEAKKVMGRPFYRRWAKVGGLFLIGWMFKKNMPGCLDHRFCNNAPSCIYCANYYSKWDRCYVPGYHPELWREHV